MCIQCITLFVAQLSLIWKQLKPPADGLVYVLWVLCSLITTVVMVTDNISLLSVSCCDRRILQSRMAATSMFCLMLTLFCLIGEKQIITVISYSVYVLMYVFIRSFIQSFVPSVVLSFFRTYLLKSNLFFFARQTQ